MSKKISRRAFIGSIAGSVAGAGALSLFPGCKPKSPHPIFSSPIYLEVSDYHVPEILPEYDALNQDDISRLEKITLANHDASAAEFFKQLSNDLKKIDLVNLVRSENLPDKLIAIYTHQAKKQLSPEHNKLRYLAEESDEAARFFEEAVMQMQSVLLEGGYYYRGNKRDIDGIIGPRTRSAIRKFKQKHGLGNENTKDNSLDKKLVDALSEELKALPELPVYTYPEKRAFCLRISQKNAEKFDRYSNALKKTLDYDDLFRVAQWIAREEASSIEARKAGTIVNVINKIIREPNTIILNPDDVPEEPFPLDLLSMFDIKRRYVAEGNYLVEVKDDSLVVHSTRSRSVRLPADYLQAFLDYVGSLNELKWLMKRGEQLERDVYKTYWNILPWLGTIEFVTDKFEKSKIERERLKRRTIAMICQESTGKPNAMNMRSGAYGLMQAIRTSGFEEVKMILKGRYRDRTAKSIERTFKPLKDVTWENYVESPELQIIVGMAYDRYAREYFAPRLLKRKRIDSSDPDQIFKTALIVFNTGFSRAAKISQEIEDQVLPLMDEPLYYATRIIRYYNILKRTPLKRL